MKKIRVAAVQLNCELGDKQKNLTHAEGLISEAAEKGATLVVLPELFNTGYRVEERDFELAEKIPGDTTDWMVSIARKYGVVLIGCILEKGITNGVIYDTSVVVNETEILGTYRKTHLWDMENVRFTKGADFPVIDLGFARIGMQICYEVGFPEGARILTYKGADLIVYPSAFGKARHYAWDIATRARALENGCFIIAANRTGQEKETEFGGYSRIVNPQGSVLEEADEENQVIITEIDLAEVVEQRSSIPYLRDLYKPIIAKEFSSF